MVNELALFESAATRCIYVKCDRLQPRVKPVTYDLSSSRGTAGHVAVTHGGECALTYGGECWALRIEDERRLTTKEMRKLRLIYRKTLKDKITKEKFREITGVDEMKEFLREQRLR